MRQATATALVVLAAAGAALLLNLVLLSRTSGSDRVGRLDPVAHVPAVTAPADVVRPVSHADVERPRERDADD